MGLSSLIKRLLGRVAIPEKQMHRLKTLPEEQLNVELGALLHDMCIRHAAEFVKEELTKKNSPFNGLQEHKFFHEIIVLNFWIVEKVLAGKRKGVLDSLYANYFRHFHFTGVVEDKTKSIAERLQACHDSWNEVTGHQDILGAKVGEFIFEKKADTLRMDIPFWIIHYTDAVMNKFYAAKKELSSAGIKI